ncbi:MAG: ATP-binding protein [Chloroflexaceae bacterium]|nr:ATP-binding protein [Chloroflexaceae bacterium]
MLRASNASAERILGLSQNQLMGRDSFDPRWRAVREDGAPFPGETHPAMVTLRTGQPCQNVIMGVHKPGGELTWISINSQPLLRPGESQPYAVVALFNDITDRKDYEQELQSQRDFATQVMSTMGQGLAVTDSAGRFVFVNTALARMSGYAPDELLGRTHEEITAEYARSSLVSFAELRRSGASGTYESALECKDGRALPVLITGVPRYQQGQFAGAIKVITDLTVQKQIEATLADARDQALDASRLKSEFLATVSHEIRTPMNGIIGMAELLLDSPLTDEQREYAGIVRQSGESLLNIINDILDFSKIEADKMTLDVVEFSLLETVESAADLFVAQAHAKRLSLSTWVDPQLPPLVQGDPVRLRQVLVNLLSNAIKFTERGHVAVWVSVASASDTNLTVVFRVVDTGTGLPPSARQRLFQPFTQVDGSMVRRFGGTGLGLAISRRLVELMEGTIDVESSEGAGSTFWFTANLARVVLGSGPLPDKSLQGRRLLIADPNPTSAEVVSRYAQAWGMQSDHTADGTMALALLQAAAQAGQPYHVLVASSMLPGSSGLFGAQPDRATRALDVPPLVLLAASGRQGSALADPTLAFAVVSTPIKQARLHDALAAACHSADSRVMDVPDLTRVAPATSIAASGHTILLVEDNAANQKLAQRQLEKLGHRVHVLNNGREAVEHLHMVGGYALILMDCQMPEMDGYTATRIIRTMELELRSIPIIAMTANVGKADRDMCLEAGMDDYISKPVSLTTLRAALERWLPPMPDKAAATTTLLADAGAEQ